MNARKRNLLLLLVSAIITGLSVTLSEYVGFLAWISMIPLALAIFGMAEEEKPRLRRIYAYGLFYFEIYYVVVFHWFTYIYPLEFTGLGNFSSLLVIITAWFGLSFLQSLFSAFLFVAAVLILRTETAKSFGIFRILSLPALYVFFEYFQTLGWWGVPWGRLPISQTDYILPIGISSLFGSYAVTFVIVLVNVLLALALKHRRSKEKTRLLALSALAVFALNLAAGGVMLAINGKNDGAGGTVRVGIVQGNRSSAEKWNDDADMITDKYLGLARECVAEGAKIIVFPETSLPIYLNKYQHGKNRLAAFAQENEVTLLVGALHYGEDAGHNAVYCFLSDGTVSETVYFKRHLVPFGEYVPMEPIVRVLLPFLSEVAILEDPMIPGDSPNVFDLNGCEIGSLICFDSIYESLSIDSVRAGAEALSISTNDSWFFDSRGIRMHNSQARLRAVELDRFVIRSANTGVSCFISDTGRVLDELPILECGHLTAEVELSDSRTLYSYIGNLFVYLCLLTALAPLARDAMIKLINHHQNFKKNSTRGNTNDEN